MKEALCAAVPALYIPLFAEQVSPIVVEKAENRAHLSTFVSSFYRHENTQVSTIQ